MQEFWKRAFDFLFKQSPVIVLAVIGLWLLWQKLERVDAQRVADRIEVRKECSEAITEVRRELSDCHRKNELLVAENRAISEQVAALKVVVNKWGRKWGNSYGSRE